jgi:hypothetical protein
MMSRYFQKTVIAGVIGILASAGLVACTNNVSGPLSSDSSQNDDRQASSLASRLCVLNGTDKTFLNIGESDLFTRVSETHPDPSGSLEPGATWCTNGFNSIALKRDGAVYDASVEITFTDAGDDFVSFWVLNRFIDPPQIRAGRTSYDIFFFEPWGAGSWETDVTIPDWSGEAAYLYHDYHVRRLDDSEYFKEWLVTVRS